MAKKTGTENQDSPAKNKPREEQKLKHLSVEEVAFIYNGAPRGMEAFKRPAYQYTSAETGRIV